MVVVNADQFFVPRVSYLAREAIAEGQLPEGALARWRRSTSLWEERTSKRAKAILQPWLPRWGWVLPSGPERIRQHRSTVDGSWLFTGFNVTGRYPPVTPVALERSGGYRLDDGERAAVREFREERDRRGVAVVLTLVPYPGASWTRAESVAAALGAPLVAPRLAGLITNEGGHLDQQSAERFVTAFLDELETLEAFQRLQQAPTPP